MTSSEWSSTHNQGPEIGRTINGKFRVERLLGKGGMGFVVEATHLELGRRVAMKFMRPELAVDEVVAARFLREAKIAASLTNDHVAKILDVGRDENGTPFFAMEFLEGEDLEESLRRETTRSFEEALDLTRQICVALSEAHSKEIVHRDIKPRNLFLARQWDGGIKLKILDFGISKMLVSEREQTELTQDTTVLGSPNYMAPEQMIASKHVDARADIWSVGVCLYRFLTGKLPFDAESSWGIGANVLSGNPRPLEDFRPETPEPIRDIVRRCLRRKSEQRYETITELHNAVCRELETVRLVTSSRVIVEPTGQRSDEPILAPVSSQTAQSVISARSPQPSSGTLHALESTPAPQHRRMFAAVGIGAAVALGGIAAAWSLLGRQSSRAPFVSLSPSAEVGGGRPIVSEISAVSSTKASPSGSSTGAAAPSFSVPATSARRPPSRPKSSEPSGVSRDRGLPSDIPGTRGR